MLINLVECTRKTKKKMVQKFFHLVDMIMYLYILYQVNVGKKYSFYKFKLEAVKELILAHSSLKECSHKSSGELPLRLTGKNM